jgi:hypothetical protein
MSITESWAVRRHGETAAIVARSRWPSSVCGALAG